MRIISLILLFTFSFVIHAQNYEMDAVAGQTINTCSGTFYDSGGSSANYSSNEHYTVTFCSDQAGSQISFNFSVFNTENGFDEMDIYEGTGTSGVQLVSGAAGGILTGQTIVSQGSGCLTFVFTSDASNSYEGWEAAISCVFPCQDFTANIIDASEDYYNGDTIQLCQNTDVTFTAAGTYPNNNVNYTQSDANSIFYWHFSDGTEISGMGLTSVSHSFTEGGAYVFLDVVDVNACDNSNLIMNTVMVSTNPSFTGTNITDTICPGEEVDFSGFVHTNPWIQSIPTITGDTTFLPDGDGTSYETSLTYNMFQPTATFTSSTDIESICLDLEHSYSGDLTISIICPNGQEVTLFDGYADQAIGNQYFGEPTDNSSNPGNAYTYCWSPSATNGTIESIGNNAPTYSYTDNDGEQVTNQQYFPGGTYEAIGNWDDLIGCPLNGDWTIHVVDNIPSDDGYIFAWSINWDTTLISSLWEFGNTYDSTLFSWSGDNITNQLNGVGTAIPSYMDTTEYYTFSVTDDFGCVYDTLVPVYIYPSSDLHCCVLPIPNAGIDDGICGLSIHLNASLFNTANSGAWTVTGPGNVSFDDTTSLTAIATADAYGAYTFTWTEYDPAGCFAADDVIINYYDGADISTTITEPLCYGGADGTASVVHNTTVDAPYTYIWDNGQTEQTSTGYSIGTYSVTVTNVHGCTSTSSATVTEPSQLTATTSSTNVNCFGGSDGTASIVAQNATPPYSYLWNDIASQTTNPAIGLTEGSYTATVTDANNCFITVTTSLSAPANPLSTNITSNDVLCNGSNEGNASVSVSGGTMPYSYLWSNGANSNNNQNIYAGTHFVTVTDANNCVITDSVEISEPTIMKCTIISHELLCLNSNTGSIVISMAGGVSPYSYHWSNGSSDQNIYNIPGGAYDLSITDANNCVLVVKDIELDEPMPVVANIFPSESTICLNSSQDLTASVVGGHPPYTYLWSTGETNTEINVSPTNEAQYSLIATDANNCISDITYAKVYVLPPITATATGNKEQICPGDPLNIIVDAQGGNENYFYVLQNGDTVSGNFIVYPNQTSTYIITISDDCGSPTGTASVDVKVLENPPLSFMPDIQYGCQALTVHFNEQSDDIGQTYEWFFGDNDPSNIGTDKNPIHIYKHYGIFDVSLIVTSVEGCKTSQTIDSLIKVYRLPEAKFFANPELVSTLKPEVSFINYTIGATDVNWSFGDGDSSIIFNPIHRYPEMANEYKITLVVISDKGCRDTVNSFVKVTEPITLYVPSGFSPDNDGINDEFIAVGSGINLDYFNMQIYNRWGEVIFESNDLYRGWNGKLNNDRYASNGTYYWLITYTDNNGIEYKKSGNVTVIR